MNDKIIDLLPFKGTDGRDGRPGIRGLSGMVSYVSKQVYEDLHFNFTSLLIMTLEWEMQELKF